MILVFPTLDLIHFYQINEPTELRFSIYNVQTKSFISEEYVILLTVNGMPADASRIGNLKTMFSVCVSSLNYVQVILKKEKNRIWKKEIYPKESFTSCAILCESERCTQTKEKTK